MASSPTAARPVTFERERGVYDIRVTRSLAHAVVKVSPQERTGQFQQVFSALADKQIPIFLIKLHSGAVSFALDESRVTEVDKCVAGQGRECTVRGDLALISVVASSMRDLTGVMVDIADSIQRAGARLYGVGDSHNSVQCLIDGGHAESAERELRSTFHLGEAQ